MAGTGRAGRSVAVVVGFVKYSFRPLETVEKVFQNSSKYHSFVYCFMSLP